ncbi:MAG: YfiR family protein [Thermodesulfovibrionales bacterium]
MGRTEVSLLTRLSNSIQGSIIFLCLCSFSGAIPLQGVCYAQQQVREYELKAVYLYNFLQFVQWPETKRAVTKDSVMVIGVVGESPFGEALTALQADLHRGGMKPVRIIQYGPYQEHMDFRECHLLFVGLSEKGNVRRIIARLKDAPVLTVADTDNFIAAGGMINLVQHGGKIRWMINRSAADKAGLRFSAQLLTIALKVVEGH